MHGRRFCAINVQKAWFVVLSFTRFDLESTKVAVGGDTRTVSTISVECGYDRGAARYRGDFFAVDRKEWDSETLEEGQWDAARAMQRFDRENEKLERLASSPIAPLASRPQGNPS